MVASALLVVLLTQLSLDMNQKRGQRVCVVGECEWERESPGLTTRSSPFRKHVFLLVRPRSEG